MEVLKAEPCRTQISDELNLADMSCEGLQPWECREHVNLWDTADINMSEFCKLAENIF